MASRPLMKRFATRLSMTNSDLTELLRKLRESNGETQKELADALGVRQSAVANWENNHNGARVPHLVDALARYGHELVVLPTEGRRRAATSSLVRILSALDDDEVESLLAVASGWGSIPAPIRSALVTMATDAAARRTAS